MAGQIVAIGGGGFSTQGECTPLEDFILSLAPRPNPRVCFIPTASADSHAYLVKFYRAFSGRAVATDLTIFDSPTLPRRPAHSSELESFVAAQDVFYVGGGNTANLLAIWRTHGLDVLLRRAWLDGAVLCGVSAGMLCWFEAGVTDSFGNLAGLPDGLGLLTGSACPHYDGESERRPTYHRLIAEGLPGGFAADDDAALYFRGTEFVEGIATRPEANTYRLELVAGTVQETRLPTRHLSAIPDSSVSKLEV